MLDEGDYVGEVLVRGMLLQQVERGGVGGELRGSPQGAALDQGNQRFPVVGDHDLIDVPDEVAVAVDQAAQRALVDEGVNRILSEVKPSWRCTA